MEESRWAEPVPVDAASEAEIDGPVSVEEFREAELALEEGEGPACVERAHQSTRHSRWL
jgi:hypothetical protein